MLINEILISFEDMETNTVIYVEQIKYLSKAGVSTVYIDFAHLESHNDILALAVQSQYYR